MNVGVHCQEPGCNQLDFLPFRCELCSGQFCSEHRAPQHTCRGALAEAKNAIVACPLCAGKVLVRNNEAPDLTISRHIDGGCRADSLADAHAPVASFRCAFGSCTEREQVRVVCDKCGLQTCLRHRAPAAHQCVTKAVLAEEHAERAAAELGREARHQSAVTRIKSLAAAASSSTSQSSAASAVRRIQQRQTATGDKRVPADERVFLEVMWPFDSHAHLKPRMMFFSAKSSVGRVLDDVAAAGNVTNRNNDSNAAKLYLISLKTGDPLPNGAKLASLLAKGELQNGDTVLLEFLENVTV